MVTLLLGADDPAAAEPLELALRREGYAVKVEVDGASACRSAVAGGTDLLLLDADSPAVDALGTCRRLRADGHLMPVVLMSERGGELDTVVGLDAGADDYVTKPIRLAELLARLRALVRRAGVGVAALDGVRVDVDARRVWLNEVELALTGKEFDLLRVLYANAGRVVTRAELMRQVWSSEWWGSTKTLDMHVSWLRRKLGDSAAAPRHITTVRGVGFRLERG